MLDLDELRGEPPGRHRPGLDHVGQQRDRRDLPGRGGRPRSSRAAASSFHTDAVQAVGQAPAGHRDAARGLPRALRPQAPRPQGRRRPVRPAQGHAVPAVPRRRPPGARPARRHGERRRDRRPGQGLRAGGPQPRGGEHPGREPCATGSRGACWPAVPDARLNGDPAEPPAQHHQHQLRVRRGRGDPAAPGRARHLRQLRARPAPPAAWSPRTCCAPWACPSPTPTARSASA